MAHSNESDSTITLTVDGTPMRVIEGVSLAAALLDAGVRSFRRSVSSEPRAPLCGMGICYECRVTVNGVPHRRACLVPVADGMTVATEPGT